MQNKSECPECYFIKYGMPCAHVLLTLKQISEKEYKSIEDSFNTGKPLPRADLERFFSASFRRMKLVAKDMGIKDYWNLKVIQRYFRDQEHNRFIDEGDGYYAKADDAFKSLCKIHHATVSKVEGDILTIKYTDGKKTKTRKVKSIVPDVKKGDRVAVHFAFAVEKL